MRRWMLPIIALLAVSVFVVRGQSQAENNPKKRNQMLKAVVHVNFSDPERQGHGLKNVENILKEVGNDAEIEVVAHGAGIVLLVQGESKHADTIRSLIDRKVKFVACRNTLRDKSIAEDRLLPGVQVTASGGWGVAKAAGRLQLLQRAPAWDYGSW